MEKEIWKDVSGYDGKYQVSNLGRLRSTDYYWGNVKMKGGIINPSAIRYSIATLYKDKKRTYRHIHRLVASHFLSNPQNKPQVNHIDSNKRNNCVSNLEWVTISENAHHAKVNNLYRKGENHYRTKVTALDVEFIQSSSLSTKELANRFHISTGSVRRIVRSEKEKT